MDSLAHIYSLLEAGYTKDQIDIFLKREAENKASEAAALEKQLELRRIELQIAQTRKDSSGGAPPPHCSAYYQRDAPRLPPWSDGEDVGAFLRRFERFSKDFLWTEDSKLHHLLPCSGEKHC